MKKSDLMGRFDFDGAEGIAFWIGDSDTEPITKVMFDELETLKAFIEHNLPGMFGAAEPDAATERELEAVKEHREKWMARAFRAETERDAATEAIDRWKQLVGKGVEERMAAEAERDAALAAVERVRAVVKSIRFLAALPPFDEGNTVMNAAADDIVAALDGKEKNDE